MSKKYLFFAKYYQYESQGQNQDSGKFKQVQNKIEHSQKYIVDFMKQMLQGQQRPTFLGH